MQKQNLILLFLVTLLTVSCQHDEPALQGSVQFSFSTSVNPGGRKQTDNIPDGASLIMSITKSNGDSVFTWKKIDLLKIGDHFITGPLPLLQGNYMIIDFIIVGSDNSVLFVAPKAGSSLAKLVKHPLPLTFNVTINDVSNVDVEVVNADHQDPENFGYASFGISVAQGYSLAVSAFVVEGGQTKVTTAKAYIIHGNDTLLHENLSAAVNNLVWRGDSTTPYVLIIQKDGYSKYVKDFQPDSLLLQLNRQPLAVILKPAYTLVWHVIFPDLNVPRIRLDATVGAKIQVDWGDHTVESVTFSDASVSVSHSYADTKKYFVSITGDLGAINFTSIYYQVADIDTISIAHLSGLQGFDMGFLQYFGKGIDFTHNSNLQHVALPFLHSDPNLAIDFSHNPLLRELDLSYDNLLTPTVLDRAINDIYASAVLYNTRNGTIDLRHFPDNSLEGPTTQLGKLYSLINDYGWAVYPITDHP